VDSLKNLIAEHENIPTQEQRLIFGGKELTNNTTLGEYSIQKESVVHLVRLLPNSPHSTSSTTSSSSSSAYPQIQSQPISQLHSGHVGQPQPQGVMVRPPGSFPQPGYPGYSGAPPQFGQQQFVAESTQQLPTTFCPYCLVPLAYFPGSRLIQCPRCTKISELKPMALLTMACGLCGCALRYAPCYSIVRCPRCQALVKTLPQVQQTPPPIIQTTVPPDIKTRVVDEKKKPLTLPAPGGEMEMQSFVENKEVENLSKQFSQTSMITVGPQSVFHSSQNVTRVADQDQDQDQESLDIAYSSLPSPPTTTTSSFLRGGVSIQTEDEKPSKKRKRKKIKIKMGHMKNYFKVKKQYCFLFIFCFFLCVCFSILYGGGGGLAFFLFVFCFLLIYVQSIKNQRSPYINMSE